MSAIDNDFSGLRPFIRVPSRTEALTELEIGFDTAGDIPAAMPCHIQVFFQPREGPLQEIASCPPRSRTSPSTFSPLRLHATLHGEGRIFVLAHLRDMGMLEFSKAISAPQR